MLTTATLDQAMPPTTAGEHVGQCSGPGRILLGVFETLDRAGIPYCVLHGYESYFRHIKSDVDCLISAGTPGSQLIGLLHRNSTRIGAEIVRTRDYLLVLAGRNTDGSPCFLYLDLSVDYEISGRLFYSGNELLEGRRRHNQFWVPAADQEFGCCLIRKIVKGYLDSAQARILSNLYEQDPAGCWRQVARFWGTASTMLIISAASSGNWEPLGKHLGTLRRELYRRTARRNRWRIIGNRLRRLAGQTKRCCAPDGGLSVAFLGPDGAGKSSVIQAVGQDLADGFSRTIRCGFAPGLVHRTLRRSRTPNRRPHDAPPRALLVSVMRAVCYWYAYYAFGHAVTVCLAKARAALVLYDRHFVDALVDARRYRYGGPRWLLGLIWKFIPKPDMIVLLDAAPEVLQARKQEVPFNETARQRQAYLSLMETVKNGHIVDASRPLDQVVSDVNDLILRYLTTHVIGRLGLQPGVLYMDKAALGNGTSGQPGAIGK